MKNCLRILLVEDDADDQLYFKDALKHINPSLICDVAGNGNEALKQIKVYPPPDLIFMDLNMPIMNGYECLITIKKESRFKNIPIIIFSTSRNVHDIQRTKELGASLFLTKPANFQTLCNKLNQIIQSDFPNQQYTV